MKVKQLDVDEFFSQLFITGESQSVEINKVTLRIDLMSKPKGICCHVQQNTGGYYGSGRGASSVADALSDLRRTYHHITGKDLPEAVPPAVRPWYVYIRRCDRLFKFTESSTRPDLNQLKIVDPQGENEDEYFFNIPERESPELDFPRDGDTIYIPCNTVWYITDHVTIVNSSSHTAKITGR